MAQQEVNFILRGSATTPQYQEFFFLQKLISFHGDENAVFESHSRLRSHTKRYITLL